MLIFLRKKKVVIPFKNANKFSRITNKDLSTIGKKFAFTHLVIAYGFLLMFRRRLYAVKQFRGARSRWTPQHENQLFFEWVITQAKTVIVFQTLY